jgi:hypothetical protein
MTTDDLRARLQDLVLLRRADGEEAMAASEADV